MGLMTFLKKLGSWINEGKKYVAFAGPLAGLTPTTKDDAVVRIVTTELTQIGAVVVSAEAAGAALGLTGPDKLQVAAPQVANVILGSALIAGKQIKDPELFRRGSTKVADGMADILNSIDPDVLQ